MKKIYLTAILLLAMLTAIALIGCSNGAADPPAPAPADSGGTAPAGNEATPGGGEAITIQLDQFSGQGGNEEALKEMIAEFNAVHPEITVKLQSFGYDDYFTQLQAKVVGGQAADVFELNFEGFVSYASEGLLLDIGGLVGDTSGFNQTALDAFSYQGTQYGIPNSFSNVILVYNKDLFDQAGCDYPTNDWTWADMLEAAKGIRALDDSIFGLYRPISFHEFYKGVIQNGGSLMNGDMTAFTVNLPQNVEALETMLSWVNEYNVMPTDAQLGGIKNEELFVSGRLGMVVIGIWMLNDFINNCDFAWDIAIEPGNTAKATHFFSNAYVVNKDTANPEAAAALASFLAGSREAASIRVAASWELPPVNYADILEEYLSITPPDNRQAIFDSLNYLCLPPVVEQQSKMQDIIGKHLESAVSGAVSAGEALDACQQELEQNIALG